MITKSNVLLARTRGTKSPINLSLGLDFICSMVSKYVYFSLREGDPDKLAYVQRRQAGQCKLGNEAMGRKQLWELILRVCLEKRTLSWDMVWILEMLKEVSDFFLGGYGE